MSLVSIVKSLFKQERRIKVDRISTGQYQGKRDACEINVEFTYTSGKIVSYKVLYFKNVNGSEKDVVYLLLDKLTNTEKNSLEFYPFTFERYGICVHVFKGVDDIQNVKVDTRG